MFIVVILKMLLLSQTKVKRLKKEGDCYHSFRHRIMSSIIYQNGFNDKAFGLQFIVAHEYVIIFITYFVIE